MAYSIYIVKRKELKFPLNKISSEEFINVIEKDNDFKWLDDDKYAAILPYNGEEIIFSLTNGKIVFGFRSHDENLLKKIKSISEQLNCELRTEDDEIL